jgi:MFS family permease
MANSTIMELTPADKRGKVFATIGTLAMVISPIGNFVGGVLGEFMNPRAVIIGSAIVGLIIVCSIVVNPEVKKFINYEAEKIDVK